MLQSGCMSTLIRHQEGEQHRVYEPYSGTAMDLQFIAAAFSPACCSSEPLLLSCPPVALAMTTVGLVDLPGSALCDTLALGHDLRAVRESQSHRAKMHAEARSETDPE